MKATIRGTGTPGGIRAIFVSTGGGNGKRLAVYVGDERLGVIERATVGHVWNVVWPWNSSWGYPSRAAAVRVLYEHRRRHGAAA